MSLYGHQQVKKVAEAADVNMQQIVEGLFYSDLSRGTNDQIQEFCNSPQAQVLVEKSVLKKGTLMRLSKSDDEKRRIKLVAYQLAKEAKDPNWDKMNKYRKLWKHHRDLIMKKHGAKAAKIAKVAQKEYIKVAQKQN